MKRTNLVQHMMNYDGAKFQVLMMVILRDIGEILRIVWLGSSDGWWFLLIISEMAIIRGEMKRTNLVQNMMIYDGAKFQVLMMVIWRDICEKPAKWVMSIATLTSRSHSENMVSTAEAPASAPDCMSNLASLCPRPGSRKGANVGRNLGALTLAAADMSWSRVSLRRQGARS